MICSIAAVRGVRLYTDNDMLPDSLNGFAPVVRGIAKSNAVVTIRQNGYIIYQSAVPQGPFALTDLNTTSSGGDLDVTIKEEDGSEQHFTQPYASWRYCGVKARRTLISALAN